MSWGKQPLETIFKNSLSSSTWQLKRRKSKTRIKKLKGYFNQSIIGKVIPIIIYLPIYYFLASIV